MQPETIIAELSELKQEHRMIQVYLKRLEPLRERAGCWNELRILCEAIEFIEAHHQREEMGLFPWLATQSFVSRGGPRCTDFMGRRFSGLSISRTYAKVADFVFQRPSYLGSESSPLEIPLEEHQVGQLLAGRILERISSATGLDSPEFRSLLGDWMDLVEQHRAKEDECLFVMIEQALKQQQGWALDSREKASS